MEIIKPKARIASIKARRAWLGKTNFMVSVTDAITKHLGSENVPCRAARLPIAREL
jgi:hypothetical protein